MKSNSGAKRRTEFSTKRRCLSRPLDLHSVRPSELAALASALKARRGRGDASERAGDPSGRAADSAPRCLFIEGSVRSGQTVEFAHGDVIVVGSVGSGAEIVASGSIHVYGALRGRALAGAAGDLAARIFCRSLDAELLAIAGRYRVAENFDPSLRGRPVQARLDGSGMTLTVIE